MATGDTTSHARKLVCGELGAALSLTSGKGPGAESPAVSGTLLVLIWTIRMRTRKIGTFLKGYAAPSSFASRKDGSMSVGSNASILPAA